MAAPRRVPPNHHPLHGFRLKLNRAETHAEALKADIKRWMECHPYAIVGKYEPGPPEEYVFRCRFFEPVPAFWGVILGDFANNARSALDHLVYQLAGLGSGGMHVDRTKFPIIFSPFKWESEAKSLRKTRLLDRHIDIIQGLQPYHGRDFHGFHTIDATIMEPLAVLRCWSNIDKHMVLNATPAYIHSIGWDFETVRDIAQVLDSRSEVEILVDDGDVIRVGITSSGPNPELKLRHNIALEVGVQYRIDLGQFWTLRTVGVEESVDAILGRLWDIFEVFVQEFP